MALAELLVIAEKHLRRCTWFSGPPCASVYMRVYGDGIDRGVHHPAGNPWQPRQAVRDQLSLVCWRAAAL